MQKHMMKYKNIKTYEKLKKILPAEAIIELDTREEIHDKFSNFSQQFRSKVFPETVGEQKNALMEQSINQASKNVSVYMHDKKQTQNTANSIQSNLEFGEHFEGFIDNKFKDQLKKNMNKEKENPVVKMFGNALIATVFQSLVIKTIESLFKISVNLETDLPISSNVLKAFNISTIALSSFKTSNQKSEYILSCMDKTILTMFAAYDEKSDLKEKKLEEQEKIEAKKQTWKSQDDHFPWLKIKTSYESIRKKLNTIVIEKLNDYENLVGVLECLKMKQELKKEGNQAVKIKYTLKNIKMTSTKDIFQNMSKYGNPRIQQFLSRLGLSDQTEQLSTATFFKSEEKNFEKKGETKEAAKLGDNKQNITSDIASVLEIDNLWSKEKEEQFKNNKQNKKELYYNEVTSSSWNEVGFLPFVQEYFIEMKKQMQRDHLLDRYADGEWLTAEELKLLANTSDLLNSCIDRKFMQSAVDAIDREVIENVHYLLKIVFQNQIYFVLQLELGLAENILKDYEEIQIKIKKSRNNFIKESLKKAGERLHDFQMKRQKEYEQEYNLKYSIKKKKLMTSICCKMEKESKFQDGPPKNLQGAKSLKLFIDGKLEKDQLVKDIKNTNYLNDKQDEEAQGKNKFNEEEMKKRKIEDWDKYIQSISQPHHSQNHKFFSSIQRHTHHPPSKLFLLESTNQDNASEEKIKHSDSFKESVMKESTKQDQEKFKLNLKAHIGFKNPHNFRKYISGGPIKPYRHIPIFNNTGIAERQPTQLEIKSAILIQKKVRKRQKEKRMRELLENKEKEKYFEYKNKIDQIRLMSKQQFRIELGESKSVKDLQIITGDEVPRKPKEEQQNWLSSGVNNNNNNTSKSAKSRLQNTLQVPCFQAKKSSLGNLAAPISNSAYDQSMTRIKNNSISMSSPKNMMDKISFIHSPDIQSNSKIRPPSGNFQIRRQSEGFQDFSQNYVRRQSQMMHKQQSIDLSVSQTQVFGKSKDIGSISPKKQEFSQQKLMSFYGKAPQCYETGDHYTNLFHYDLSSDSDLRISQVQQATKPIERQLKNIKLIQAAENNQFWAINTNNFVFSKRDLFLARDKLGKTALHWAAYHKNIEFIQWLLDKGADPNAPDLIGNTPTHIAFLSNKKDLILLMINGGGDLNCVNQKGESPLFNGSEEILKLLRLDRGMKSFEAVQQQQNIIDNNSLLTFVTREEMQSFREELYANRFDSKRFTKQPNDRLNKQQQWSYQINE